MAGRNAQQSRILHSVSGSPQAFVEVEEITDISGPTGTANQIDTTHLRSSAKEYLPGLADGGNVTLSGNYIGGTKQADLYAMWTSNADPEPFRLAFPTTSAASTFDVFSFTAAVTQFQLGAKVDDKQTMQITLKISGAVTRQAAVASAALAS